MKSANTKKLDFPQNIQGDTLNQILNNQFLQHNQPIYSENLCIHQLFEIQVEQTPDAVAVIFENTQITYQQLNQRANQLAHYLISLGVGTQDLIGICLERSLEMVVGLLGILKAGAAYVPLDPAYPAERLAFILADTQTPIILTQERLVTSLQTHSGQVVCLDSHWELIAQNSQENPICKTTSDHLIYIIYTSGSTGQPKGVMIPHQGIYNQLFWRQKTFELTAADKVLQNISFSFDPSVWQIFWPLCFGAKLVLVRPGGNQDTSYIVKLIIEEQITVLALVPSLLRVLLEEEEIENCQCLRHITCGGEALPVELIERFFARLNLDNVLHNCYGPTEASIDATFWTCQRQTNYTIAPIGRPITNTEIYILDENLQPVSTGESGELYIGGIGLAQGYLNRPELTEEKFIPNPFFHRSQESGVREERRKKKDVSLLPFSSDRLYKTGDLARYLPDGNIEFLGRIDYQVKIRGFRIELGEIEAVLSQHPTIAQSVVIVYENVPGDKRLVAYIVPNPEQTPIINDLQPFLSQKLPDYMIPSAFIVLDAFPLTPNGKVDRLLLSTPDLSRQEVEGTFVHPRNEVERQLTQIWEQVLGIQPIGIRDNFFTLGGHSLLAIKLFWEIEKTFAKNLPLSILFQSGTIETLAQIIDPGADVIIHDESKSSWSSLVAIQPKGSKPPFFCVHGLGGEILCFQKLAQYLGTEQPFYGLQPQNLNDKHSSCNRIENMASHYIQEIQTLQPQGPYYLGGYSFGGVVAFEMARQFRERGEEVGILVILDTCLPGYSERSPLLKRIFLHLDNFVHRGPNYFWQKIIAWSQWGKYQVKNKYKHYLESLQNLSKTDKHWEIIDTNIQAADEYNFQVYPDQITLLRTEDESRENALRRYDSQFGWGNLAAEGVDIHYIPGSHISFLDEPHVQVVAEKLKDCLDKA